MRLKIIQAIITGVAMGLTVILLLAAVMWLVGIVIKLSECPSCTLP